MVWAQARRSWHRLLAVSLVAVVAAACGGDEPPPVPTAPSVPSFAVQCPADVLRQSPTGAAVPIQLPAATTSGGVAPATVTCVPSGNPYPVGTTRIVCQASDSLGAIASCTFNVNVAPPPLGRTTFLAFGDSMTAGEITAPLAAVTGVDGSPLFRQILVPAESYPTKLLALLRARYFTQASQFVVTNAGSSREWAVDGVNRLPTVMAATNAQVVLLLSGANDIQAVPQLDTVEAAALSLRTMIRFARGRGAIVFVATLPPGRLGGRNSLNPSLVQTFNGLIRAGATAEGAVLVDLNAAMAADVNTLIGTDGLHPTAAGYQRMAETFFTAIRAFEGR